MIKKIIEDKRYRFKLHLLVGVTCEQAKKAAEKLGFELDDSKFGGFNGDMYEGIMWMHKKPSEGTIAHECSHIAMHVMHQKGILISYDNDEGIAYQQEFWVDSVSKALK